MNGDIQDELCAVFLGLVSITGIVFNAISAVVLIRNTVFKNAFGMLTTLHTMANIGVLSIFLLWSCPLMLLGLSPRLAGLNKHIGQLSLFFQEIAFHACFFISVNRLLAITTPAFYRNKFTRSVAGFLIIFVCSISALYVSIYFYGDCGFYFNVDLFTFQFSNNECGNRLSLYIDLIYNCSLFGVMGSMDLVTLSMLIKTKKGRENTPRIDSLDDHRSLIWEQSITLQRLSLHTGTKQSIREARFFFQAVINSLVYCLMLISFDVIAPRTKRPLALFFWTTGTWAIGHTCGGLILAIFNREISRLFVHPRHFVTWIFDSRSANSIPNNATQPSPNDNISTF